MHKHGRKRIDRKHYFGCGNGKTVTYRVLDLMNQVNQLTHNVKNKTNMFDDVHHLIQSLEKPIDEIGELLSPKMRKC